MDTCRTWCQSDDSGEGLERHLREIVVHDRLGAIPIIVPDLEIGIGELIRQDAVACRDGAPTPPRRREIEDCDLHRVARLRSVDEDRPRERRKLALIELVQLTDSGGWRDLAAGAVDNVELDRVAGGDRPCRTMCRAPAEVTPMCMDGMSRSDRHVRPGNRFVYVSHGETQGAI